MPPSTLPLVLALLMLGPLAARGAGLRMRLVQAGRAVPLDASNAHRLDDLPLLRVTYEELQEPVLRAQLERDATGSASPVEVHLIDDRGRVEDVWPHASGSQIEIGESFRTWYTTRDAVRAMLAHEVAHTRDRATKEHDAYGLDGRHQFNDVITPRAAMIEGWANYRGARFDPMGGLFKRIVGASPFRRKEDAARAGSYRWHPFNSYDDRIGNETTVTTVLRALEASLGDGRAKIERAFEATNDGSPRTLDTFIARLARDNPGDATRIALVLDRATSFTATDARLRSILGPAGERYARRWRTPARIAFDGLPLLALHDVKQAALAAGRALRRAAVNAGWSLFDPRLSNGQSPGAPR